MAGTIDMTQEMLDATLVATLPVGGNLTLLTAIAAGMPAAAGVYVASKIFKKQVDKVASVSYRMSGTWSDPEVKFERWFDNKAAKRAGENTQKTSDSPELTPHDTPPEELAEKPGDSLPSEPLDAPVIPTNDEATQEKKKTKQEKSE